jgi:hypothetical protein
MKNNKISDKSIDISILEKMERIERKNKDISIDLSKIDERLTTEIKKESKKYLDGGGHTTYKKEWYKKNSKKVKNYNKEYYEKHKEKQKEKMLELYYKNLKNKK